MISTSSRGMSIREPKHQLKALTDKDEKAYYIYKVRFDLYRIQQCNDVSRTQESVSFFFTRQTVQIAIMTN